MTNRCKEMTKERSLMSACSILLMKSNRLRKRLVHMWIRENGMANRIPTCDSGISKSIRDVFNPFKMYLRERLVPFAMNTCRDL